MRKLKDEKTKAESNTIVNFVNFEFLVNIYDKADRNDMHNLYYIAVGSYRRKLAFPLLSSVEKS